MNRFLKQTLTVGLVFLGLITACNPQSSSVSDGGQTVMVEAAASDVANPGSSVTFLGANWTFKCPNNNWIQIDSDKEEVQAFIDNAPEKQRVLFLSKPFDGPVELFPTVLLSSVKDQGGQVITTSKVTIHGNVFTYASITDNKEKISGYMWLLAKNKKGYVFICGGPQSNGLDQVCNSIANTLQIN